METSQLMQVGGPHPTCEHDVTRDGPRWEAALPVSLRLAPPGSGLPSPVIQVAPGVPHLAPPHHPHAVARCWLGALQGHHPA